MKDGNLVLKGFVLTSDDVDVLLEEIVNEDIVLKRVHIESIEYDDCDIWDLFSNLINN